MNAFQIFGLQTTLSLIVYALIAKWYVWPRLTALPLYAALDPLLFFHAMRHIGMTLLVAVILDPALPREFTVPWPMAILWQGCLRSYPSLRFGGAGLWRFLWCGFSTSGGRWIC